MVARTSLLVSSIALLTSFVNAYGQIAQVVDANNFCVFLPPTDSTDRLISDTEWNAQAFCLGSTPKATNAGKLKTGFIQSAHYVKTDAYVQITGQIDPTKENLDPTDDGGQYDVRAPNGATCAGWKYFVNLIEPSGNTYCMRCCNDTTNCNRGISAKGCAHIIPGDYSGPFGGVESTPAAASSSSSEKSSSTKSASSTKTDATTTTSKAEKTTSKAEKTTSKAVKTTSNADSSKPTTTAAADAGTGASDDDSSSTAAGAAADGSSSTTDATADIASTPGSSAESANSASTDGDASSSSASASPNAAAEIASPPSLNAAASSTAASADAAASSSPSGVNGVVSEQSINQSASGAESLRPVILTLAITAVSIALIQ